MKDFIETTGYMLTLHMWYADNSRSDWHFICATENLAQLAYQNIIDSGQTEIYSYDIKEVTICTLKIK